MQAVNWLVGPGLRREWYAEGFFPKDALHRERQKLDTSRCAPITQRLAAHRAFSSVLDFD
jgi:hypothetical protein